MNGDYGRILLKRFRQSSQDSLSRVPDWKCMLGNVVRSWTIALCRNHLLQRAIGDWSKLGRRLMRPLWTRAGWRVKCTVSEIL